MNLPTFLKMYSPGFFMRGMILGAQGIFSNTFISYLLSPRTCHRFVGSIEEEAVFAYTSAINDLNAGNYHYRKTCKLPKSPSVIGACLRAIG